MSGVGSEEVDFEPSIPLEGKVEIYMQVTIAVSPFFSLSLDFVRFSLLRDINNARGISFSGFPLLQQQLHITSTSLYLPGAASETCACLKGPRTPLLLPKKRDCHMQDTLFVRKTSHFI